MSTATATAAVAWQFSSSDQTVRAARERRALRIIAIAFFALAVYVTVDAVTTLAGDHQASESLLGIVIAALSVLMMSLLSYLHAEPARNWGRRRRSPIPNRP